MQRNTSRAPVLLALFLAGAITTNGQRHHPDQSLDLIRFLATKPWAGRGHNRWDRAPRFDADLVDRFGSIGRWGMKPKANQDEGSRNYVDDDLKMDSGKDLTAEIPETWGESVKRSAMATVLNGRKRRQQEPALGKAVTPYVGVGIVSDVDFFFDLLRGNVGDVASLRPLQDTPLLTDAPSVVRAPSIGDDGSNGISSGGGIGGGTGMRRLHALRPLRPTGNIRTYNRRSFVETDGVYPGANHHDPGLLWTGLGRR